jgi:formate dehydrogenase accessory protein FdhE
MQDHKTSLLDSIEKIEREGLIDRETCLMLSDIFGLQNRLAAELTDGVSLPRLIVESGLPIDSSLLRIDTSALEILREGFDEFRALVQGRLHGVDFSVIRQTMTTHPLYVEKVITHLIEKNTKSLHNMADNAGVDFDDFMFLIINWLKPLFLALRDKYPPAGQPEHDGGSCPFCGYYPDMGIISSGPAEGRYLRCGLCETLWLTRNLSCPLCGETKAEKIQHFAAEEGKYGADACHSCGGYIKSLETGDSRPVRDIDLTVENLLSIRLDGLMQQKGFNRQ